MEGEIMSYFIPSRSLKPIPKILNKTPDELMSKITKMQNSQLGEWSTQWIFLNDCVSRGTISPMEAYDALDLGYLPEHLKGREGHYEQML
jgi:hypothetical protein